MLPTPETLDRQRELLKKPLASLTDGELMELLGVRYASEPVPPCRVCGGALSVASCGGGRATEYACSDQEEDPERPGWLRQKAGRGIADEHYSRSRWTHYHPGDEAVRELIDRFRAATRAT